MDDDTSVLIAVEANWKFDFGGNSYSKVKNASFFFSDVESVMIRVMIIREVKTMQIVN